MWNHLSRKDCTTLSLLRSTNAVRKSQKPQEKYRNPEVSQKSTRIRKNPKIPKNLKKAPPRGGGQIPNSWTIFFHFPEFLNFSNIRIPELKNPNEIVFTNSRTIFSIFPNLRTEKRPIPEFPNPLGGGSQTLWSEVVFVYDSMPLLREHEFASIWHIVRHFMTRTRVRVRV